MNQQLYEAAANAALEAFQRGEIGFQEWNKLQTNAANSYWQANAKSKS